MAVAIASAVSTISISAAALDGITETAASLSADGIVITADVNAGAKRLTDADLHVVTLTLSGLAKSVLPIKTAEAILISASGKARVIATNLQRGRGKTPQQGITLTPQVAHRLFKRDPVGQALSIQSRRTSIETNVVEVETERPTFLFGSEIFRTATVPLRLLDKLAEPGSIDAIQVIPNASTDLERIKPIALAALTTTHPGAVYNATDSGDKLRKLESLVGTLRLSIVCCSAVSIIVAVTCLANILLLSCFERRDEIAIRRALGARRADIAALFYAESAMYALLGGIVGLILGFVLAGYGRHLLAQYIPISTISPIVLIVSTLAAAASITVAAAVLPARRAAQQSLIDGLG